MNVLLQTEFLNRFWSAFASLFESYMQIFGLFPGQIPTERAVIYEQDTTIATVELDAEGVASFVASQSDQALITTAVDMANVFGWDSVTAQFDLDGNLVSRTSSTDAGFVQIDTYDAGQRVAKDLIDGADEFIWATVRNLYDSFGRTQKETTLDNGIFRVDSFVNDVRVATQQTDNSTGNDFSWATIDATYDLTGEIQARTISYDNGETREDTYIDGSRVTAFQRDAAQSQNAWETILSSYGFDGALSSKVIAYDNGILRTDQFQFGNRVNSTQTDDADAFIWDTKERLYDAGVITSQKTVQDDADIIVMLYLEGQRDARIDYDISNAEDWTVRRTNYDETGVVSVETFDNTDILATYPGFFGIPEENPDTVIG